MACVKVASPGLTPRRQGIALKSTDDLFGDALADLLAGHLRLSVRGRCPRRGSECPSVGLLDSATAAPKGASGQRAAHLPLIKGMDSPAVVRPQTDTHYQAGAETRGARMGREGER